MDEFTDDEIIAAFDFWPDCIVGGCRNKCCRRLESPYCHPHTLLKMVYENNQSNHLFHVEMENTFAPPTQEEDHE